MRRCRPMSEFLSMLLRLSLFGSALAVLLFLLKPLMRGRVSRRVQYYLWLLVLLRLCVPMGLTLPLPSGSPAVPEPIPIAAEDFTQAPAVQTPEPQAAVRPQTPPAGSALAEERGISPDTAFFLLWAAGAAGFAGWYIAGYGTLCRRVRTGASAPRREAVDLLREMDPSGKVRLVESSAVDTPLLLGVVRPAIVLPSRYADPGQLRDIFAHELTHVRRHDLLYKWFAAFAASVHWFNPLLFFVRREVGRACELACDEAVIRTLDASDRRHYGETLLSLAVPARPLPLAVTMCEEKRNLKERLVAIVKLRKKGPLTVLLTLVLVAVAVCCALFISAAPRETAEQFRTPSGYLTLEMGMTRKEVDKQMRYPGSFQEIVQWSEDWSAEAVRYENGWKDSRPVNLVTVYYDYSQSKETDVVVGLATQGDAFTWNSRSGGTYGQTAEELQALYPEGRRLTVSTEDGGKETFFYVPYTYGDNFTDILTFYFDQNGRVDAMTIGYDLNPYLDGAEHFYNTQRETILRPGMSREAVEASLGQGQAVPEEDPRQFTMDWQEIFPKGLPEFYTYGTGADRVLVGYLEDEAIVVSVSEVPSNWKVLSGITTGDKRSAMKQYKYLQKYGDIYQIWRNDALLTAHTDSWDGILHLDLIAWDYANTVDTQEHFAPEPLCNDTLDVMVNLNMTKAEMDELLGRGTLLSQEGEDSVYRYGEGADALEVRYQRGYVMGLQAGSEDGAPFHWKTQSGIGYGSSVKQASKHLKMSYAQGSGELEQYTVLVPSSMNVGYSFFSGLAAEEQGVIQLSEQVVWSLEEYAESVPQVPWFAEG